MGLSAKLLWLTILFVMVAEVMIFVPSVANLPQDLAGRAPDGRAHCRAFGRGRACSALPRRTLRENLLETAKVEAVALKREDFRSLLSGSVVCQPRGCAATTCALHPGPR